MAVIVYILCAFTSLACAVLLTRGYLASRHRLLLWSSLCFAGLALNNILLVVDLVVVRNLDLSYIRIAPAVVGMALLTYGLVWDSE